MEDDRHGQKALASQTSHVEKSLELFKRSDSAGKTAREKCVVRLVDTFEEGLVADESAAEVAEVNMSQRRTTMLGGHAINAVMALVARQVLRGSILFNPEN